MSRLDRTDLPDDLARVVALAVILLLLPRHVSAQGCMPVRFVSPVAGGQGDVYLRRHRWQAGVAYRRLSSNQFIVGHKVRNDLGPQGEASFVESNSIVLSLARGLTDRLSLAVNVPFASGSSSHVYKDLVRHRTSARGLGEVNLMASYWLRGTGLQPGGNLSIGVGVKAPTGKHAGGGYFWKQSGDSIPFPVDQSIQLSDGGWRLILQVEGFEPLFSRTYVYAAGSYTANPRKTTEVVLPTNLSIHWGVPDTFNARVGAAMTIWPERGVTISLGGRVDGTTRKDLIGGRDDGFRRPGIVGYVDPGISATWRGRSFALDVPVRAYKRFRPSYLDPSVTGRPGGGGLARYLVLVSLSQRFGREQPHLKPAPGAAPRISDSRTPKAP